MLAAGCVNTLMTFAASSNLKKEWNYHMQLVTPLHRPWLNAASITFHSLLQTTSPQLPTINDKFLHSLWSQQQLLLNVSKVHFFSGLSHLQER